MVWPCCGQVTPVENTKFFAHGMGRGVQSGPPFFFRYPPRPSAFETPKGRICCATLATGTTSPNPGSRYPAQPASTHPAPPGFAAYLLRSIRKSQHGPPCNCHGSVPSTALPRQATGTPARPQKIYAGYVLFYETLFYFPQYGLGEVGGGNNRVVRQNKSRWFLRLNSKN